MIVDPATISNDSQFFEQSVEINTIKCSDITNKRGVKTYNMEFFRPSVFPTIYY